jgi:hypothetical protein
MQWWQWLLVLMASFVLAIVILIYGVYTFLRYKLKQFGSTLLDAFKALGSGPLIPQTFSIQPASPEHLKDRTGLDQIVSEMKGLGLQVDGPFQSEQDYAGDIIVYTLADPARSVTGAVMLSKAKGAIYDFVTEYADGMFATHGNLPDQGMDKPEWVKHVRMPGASARELLEAHLSQRPQKPMAMTQLADVPSRIKFFVEEEYFWRATRGGLTDAELDRHLAQQPENTSIPAEERKQARKMVTSMVRGQADAFLREKFHDRLLKSLTMSPAEWEKIEHRLVYVFEAADLEGLAHYVEPPMRKQLAGEDTPEDDASDDEEPVTPSLAALRQGPVREAFAQLNGVLDSSRQLVKLSTVEIESRFGRAAADVYVAPAEDQAVGE